MVTPVSRSGQADATPGVGQSRPVGTEEALLFALGAATSVLEDINGRL
jgi:hypothetical protein